MFIIKGYFARYIVLAAAVFMVSGLFIARLAQWQILQSGYYTDIAAYSYKYVIKSDAVRGEIFDVNGKGLAVNLTGYEIVLNKLYISDEDMNEIISGQQHLLF